MEDKDKVILFLASEAASMKEMSERYYAALMAVISADNIEKARKIASDATL